MNMTPNGLWSIALAGLLSVVSLGAGLRRAPGVEAAAPERMLRFTILYDNYLYREGTKADWGFSCLIEGTEKTILFDTGTSPGCWLTYQSVG